jgi:RNA polymerase sigma factor (TIGR02999 family)
MRCLSYKEGALADESQSEDRLKKLDEWFSIAYAELRKLASMVKSNDANASLSTQTLVHDAWIKLAKSPGVLPESELHFKRTAAKVMRDIVRDEARRRNAKKHGGDFAFVTLDDSNDIPLLKNQDLLTLDAELDVLALVDPRAAEVFEARFYGGLTTAQIATLLGVSEKTVERDWRSAKAWLKKEIRKSH